MRSPILDRTLQIHPLEQGIDQTRGETVAAADTIEDLQVAPESPGPPVGQAEAE